jgi:hypothetical protein
MITEHWRNDNDNGKQKYPDKTLSVTMPNTNLKSTSLESNLALRGDSPANNLLDHRV